MLGAAVSTLISFMVIAAGIYVASQRLYHVPYEWGRILKVILSTAVVYAAFLLAAPEAGTLGGIAAKLLLMAAFGVLIYVTRAVHPSEIAGTMTAVRETSGATVPPADLPADRQVP
jgi:hypothetical protein